MKTKIIITIMMIAALTACAKKGTLAIQDKDGKIVSGVVMTSKDYRAVRIAEAEAKAAEAFYAAQEVKFSKMNGTEIALEASIVQLGGKSVMPKNSHDVAIAKENGSVAKTGAWLGFGSSIIKGTLTGLGIVEGARTVRHGMDLFGKTTSDALANAGTHTTINGERNTANTTSQRADNNSVVSDSGNYDEAAGIPLDSHQPEPIIFGGQVAEEAPIEGAPD